MIAIAAQEEVVRYLNFFFGVLLFFPGLCSILYGAKLYRESFFNFSHFSGPGGNTFIGILGTVLLPIWIFSIVMALGGYGVLRKALLAARTSKSGSLPPPANNDEGDTGEGGA